MVADAAIIALRDSAMAMLKEGFWHDDGKGHRLLFREVDGLRLAYAGPFQGATAEDGSAGRGKPRMKHFATASDRSGHLPHKLNVWWRTRLSQQGTPSQKVFSITWSDDGKLTLITYRPGSWEKHIADCS
jgi:hypothetical protein